MKNVFHVIFLMSGNVEWSALENMKNVMVLANNGGVVSSGLESFWESPLFLIEDSAIVILHESIDVTVFGCDDNCSGGTT